MAGLVPVIHVLSKKVRRGCPATRPGMPMCSGRISMKAGIASPNGVAIADVEQPKPKSTDILVKIKAIALNRADLGSARGDTSHGAAAGKPVGSEFSGEVIEIGGEVKNFKVGDRVMCHSPGSHAEYAVSDYGRAMQIPDGMSYETA